MTQTFSWNGIIVVMVVISSLFFTQSAQAEETCGNIIQNGDSQPITNCANPFNGTEEAPTEVKLNGISITPNTDITVQNGAWSIFDVNSPQFSISLYKKEGNDYVFWHPVPDNSIRQYRDQGIQIKKLLENEYYYNVINQNVNWSAVSRTFTDIGDDYTYVYDFEHDYAPYASMLTTGNYTLVLTSTGGGPGGPQLSRTDIIKTS